MSRVTSPLIWVITIVTLLITLRIGRIPVFPFDNMAHVDRGGIISRGSRVSAPQSQTRFRAQGITLRFSVLFCSLGLN